MTTETPRWFKSSYSENGGQCIEATTNLLTTYGTVAVRDSKNPTGPHLTLSTDAWSGLIEFARHTAV
ncbi:DUF397 domain-containing protein [Streptomyces chrestomyceticus]|uniref:DUF397 domain-containing protein n=1 Tax=Streptomyces chrestomyceticus TaxID=68185 RepID=UPI0035A90608